MLPILHTERLTLRPATTASAANCFALDQDPEVMRYLGGVPPNDTLTLARERLDRAIARHADDAGFGLGVCRLKSDDQFVGWFMLKPCALEWRAGVAGWLEPTEHVELGYRLARAHWGKGYATEVSRRLLEHGFGELGLAEIVGVTHVDNLASRRVLEKLGFEEQGRARYQGSEVDVRAATRPPGLTRG
jgi:RimJ/RimL family protein N-acetyltransferase